MRTPTVLLSVLLSLASATAGAQTPPPARNVTLDDVIKSAREYNRDLRAAKEHLTQAGTASLVTRISITVPVPEMNLFSCTRGLLDSASIPFDRAKYLAAWKQMVDVYQSAFPTTAKLISAPQNGICLNDGDTKFFREVMDYALSKDAQHFGMFAADLSAVGSARVQPYVDLSSRAAISFQPVAAFSNDPNRWVKGTMLELYCAGLKLGGSYFEVYSADLTNADPAVQQGIGAIHDPSRCP